MRLASYVTHGRAGYGVVVGAGVVDMRLRMGPRFSTLLDVLREGVLDEFRARVAGVRADYPLTEVKFLPPIVGAANIFCIAPTTGLAGGAEPDLFLRPPASLVGHLDRIVRPRGDHPLEPVGAIALVIGREGRRIRPEQALGHVAGYTLCNAGTVRDATTFAAGGTLGAVGYDASGSIGPWITTADAIDLRRPIRLVGRINGEARRDVTVNDMAADFASAIAAISLFTTLKPGDVIVTATPAGAGSRAGPPHFVEPGDVVEIAVEEIGSLRNEVVDEP